jgi:hypothetical protein
MAKALSRICFFMAQILAFRRVLARQIRCRGRQRRVASVRLTAPNGVQPGVTGRGIGRQKNAADVLSDGILPCSALAGLSRIVA